MRMDLMAERNSRIVSMNDADVVTIDIPFPKVGADNKFITYKIRVEHSRVDEPHEIRIIVSEPGLHDECVWSVLDR